MRLNGKLLRSRLSGSAKHCQFLDLSGLSLDHIEGLDAFVKLQTLRLCHNNIDYVCNLECCTNLWHLDLSHNQIQNLEGLEKFLALGTLSLSGNKLTWSELSRLQHMHILNLNLHNNPHLQKDPYYRLHVIDCLPNVWMLDGRIITSGERIQVEQFFNDSALGEHPVRHKLPKRRFTPTVLSQRGVSGVFGEKTVHLFTRFSSVSQLNRELDWKRLMYLAYNLQEDLQLQAYYTKTWRHTVLRKHPTFLEHLVSTRDLDRPACNMMLMLLVASLEFSIPEKLLQDTLSHAKLHTLGWLDTIGLFLLPSEIRCSTVSLLLSAAKVDRDSGEDGGLYDKLYLSLYFCVSELAQRDCQPTTETQVSGSKQLVDSRSLIAAEIVQLFCIVPTFFDYITKDSGVMKIVTMATGCHDMVSVVQSTLLNLEADELKEEERYVIIADLLLSSIQKNVLDICQCRPSNHGGKEHFALKTGKCIPKKPVPASLVAADYQSQGRPSPRRSPLHRTTSAREERRNPCSKSADLGDRILLGPQVIGRIISIPEPDLVLVQVPEIPVDSGAMLVNIHDLGRHYTYQDLEELCWDAEANYWRLKGTMGDRITFQKIPEDETQLTSRPKTASTISSSSPGRRTGAVRPPGATPRTHESVTNCLPSVAATYKAVHQLSLVAHRTKSVDRRQPTPPGDGDGEQNDQRMESEGNGKQPVVVQLLGREVSSNASGTSPDPTRPNSASSDHLHGEMLTSEDESPADESQENRANEDAVGEDAVGEDAVGEDVVGEDAGHQLEETGKEDAEANNENQNNKDLECSEDGDTEQGSDDAWRDEERVEEQGEEADNENNNATGELDVKNNAFRLDNNEISAEYEDNEDLNGDEDFHCITSHEDKQEEDKDGQNIAQCNNNQKETENDGDENITADEDDKEEDEDDIAEHEDTEGAAGVEDNESIMEQEDSKYVAESESQWNAEGSKVNEIADDNRSKGSQTESNPHGDQSPRDVQGHQNSTVELDPDKNALESDYETEGQEIVSDGKITALPPEEASVGENESRTVVVELVASEIENAVHSESVENNSSDGSKTLEDRSLEAGVDEPTKDSTPHAVRDAGPAAGGQHGGTVKHSAGDANKRAIVSSSDPYGNLRLVMEEKSDSHRDREAEEATTSGMRKSIGAVRFLEPPSALRVDLDRERRNCPRSTRWLGEGRDLYRERTVRHPRHVPGWMEGMTFRPSTSLSTRRLLQFPGQSSSGQSSLEVSQRMRIGSRSAPAFGRTQKLLTTTSLEVIDLFSHRKILPSTFYNKGGKPFQATPSIVRGISQLQPRIIPASTSKARAPPICRDCRKRHGRAEPCFRAAFSADADDADAMPYDEFFRLHLPSPSGTEGHAL